MHWRQTWKVTWHRTSGWVVGIVAAVALVGGGVFIPSGEAVAHAAATTHTTQTREMREMRPAFGVPHESSKVTLPELSIDGPAFWSQVFDGAPSGPLTVIAWTGTDHRLNFMGGNGVSFFGKVTLNETSFVRPAVVRGQGEGDVAPVALAWTGTDALRHLNVLYRQPNGATMKLTVSNNTSFTAPAIGWLTQDTTNKTLLLGWAGTDVNHSLNLLPISITSQGLLAGTKTTFRDFHSFGPPSLSVAVSQGSLFPAHDVLSWSDLATHRLAWALSLDGQTWTQQPLFPETSEAGPGMRGVLGINVPQYWTAWTGDDAAHHVNVLYAVNFATWSTSFVKAKLPETAVGGSQVGFVFSDELFLAWTGTDALHHLNVAKIGV